MLPISMTHGILARLPDFLVIGQEDWDEVERRNQLLIRALAERNRGTRFLFAEQSLRPREATRRRPSRVRQVADNIWAVRAIRPLPDGTWKALSDRVEAATIARAARRLGLGRPILWTQDSRTLDLLPWLPHCKLLYDLTDDWAAFEDDPSRRRLVQDRIEAFGRQADLVLACSRSLEAGARVWADGRVEYLPNAVDPPRDPVDTPEDLARLPGPRLGYAGTLHAARLDVELLVGVARLRPEWSLVFLGPDLLDEPSRRQLLALPNVHHLGVRPHDQVRAYLAGFDVCLLPNLVNDFTRSLDPLKIYEYLAAGRPIVSTPVETTPDLGDQISIAETPEQMVAAAEELMSEDSERRVATRRESVADETWQARAQQIERLLGIDAAAAPTDEVSVVIVSYNTRDLLEECLTTLRDQSNVRLQTIVVDNASEDGSVEMVRRRFPDVELIETGENAGFAKANNIAFDRCRGEYILLLNSDAFLEPGAIEQLVAAARRHPRAGAVGARLLNPDRSLQRSAWPFPVVWRLAAEAVLLHRLLHRVGVLEDLRTWAHDDERTVDFLIGACLLLRRDALSSVGGFDERFWLYGEEADLQRRMRDKGWSVLFTPHAVAVHVAGGSSADSTTRLRNFYSGQLRFLEKHSGRLARYVGQAVLILTMVLRRRWTAAAVAARLRL